MSEIPKPPQLNQTQAIPSAPSSSGKKYLVIMMFLFLIIVVIGAALAYFLASPKNNAVVPTPKISISPVNLSPTIPYKTEYQNPFGEKPTEKPQNPFDNLK